MKKLDRDDKLVILWTGIMLFFLMISVIHLMGLAPWQK